jgi:hypothetical protein
MSLPDIAELGFSVNSKPAVDGAQDLDKLTAATGRAEAATTKLTATERAFGQTTTAAFSPVRDAATATKMLAAEQEALVKTQTRLNAAHGDAVKSTRNLTYAGLGLSRQLADIGVQGSQLNANWGMIFIQQAPQIVDIFAGLKAEGIGVSAALKAMYVQAAPLLAILAPIALAAGAVGSVFALSAQQINKENKDLVAGLGLTADQLDKVKNKTVTMGDVAVGTFNAAKGALASAFGDELNTAGKAIDKFFDDMAAKTVKEAKAIVGGFMGAFEAVKATWSMLPGAFGDATVKAAQAALDALAKLVNGAIGLINPVIGGLNSRFKLGLPQLDRVAFGKLRNEYEGQMAATAKAGADAFARGNAAGGALVEKGLAAITRETLRAAQARIKDEAGKAKAAKATKDHADRVQLETDVLVAQNEIWPERAAAMEAAAKQAKALAAAQQALNDNIKASDRPATGLENLIAGFEEALSKADATRYAVEDIFSSIAGNDWAGAFSGLLRAIDLVKKAFDSAATSKDKMSAIAGVAQGVGGAIGGSTGSAISGAASGAMTGFTMGGVPGAVIGGLLGGISSLFGSSKAKKQAKAEAEAQRLAAEQARLQEVANQKRSLELQLMEAQGWSFVALTAQRADELAKMDATNRALAEQVYAAQDAAKSKELEIQLLEATGQAEAALSIRRHQTLATLSEQDQALQKQIWAAQDATKAAEALADAQAKATAEAEALAEAQAKAAEVAARAAAEAAQAQADLNSARQADAATLVSNARSALTEAYQREASAIEATRDRLSGFASDLKAFRLSLSGGAGTAGSDFFKLAAKARLGDADALGQLVSAGTAADAAAKAGASSQQEYLREQAKIRSAVQAAEDTANRQVTIADQQLAALNAQVSGLVAINSSVLTVAAGIAALQSALAVQTGTFGGAVANPNRNWGANADANMLLARGTGYGGDFGSGGFQKWIEAQDESTKATARAILQAQGQAYRIAFATGGSFEVGGSGSTDTTPINFMATPGEMVNVTKGDTMGEMVAELRALRSEVASLRADGRRTADATVSTAKTLKNVTPNGDAIQTEAAA